jgi:hypothetical protein
MAVVSEFATALPAELLAMTVTISLLLTSVDVTR